MAKSKTRKTKSSGSRPQPFRPRPSSIPLAPAAATPILRAASPGTLLEIDALVRPQGLVRAVPAAELDRFSQNDLSAYAVSIGLYQFPTTELIAELERLIDSWPAIEIGAGLGIVGRDLGIPMTDSKRQDDADVKAIYDLQEQARISYPHDVERLDALSAIEKYRPLVVVGSWITQRWNEARKVGNFLGGGVDEYKVLKAVTRYIVIGNEHTHGNKDILGAGHGLGFSYPWLISRSMDRAANRLYVFDGIRK